MFNNLFNLKIVENHSKEISINPNDIKIINNWKESINKKAFIKETKTYPYFQEYILRDLLGYLPEDYIFDAKMVESSERVEFAIKHKIDNGNCKIKMVIELKGQSIDLDKPQKRAKDKRSPVDQAWGYSESSYADWILVSNYEEFRLYYYHSKKGKYISFTIDDLVNEDNLRYFKMLFSKKFFIEEGIVDKIKNETILIEKEITQNLYNLYHETRLMLIYELETTSNLIKKDAIHYTQIILNRILFICFAEDDSRSLLPPEILEKLILKPIRDRVAKFNRFEIWRNVNLLFLDLKEGNEYAKIPQYNGGLFLEDLSFIRINDVLKDFKPYEELEQNHGISYNQINELLGDYKKNFNPIWKNILLIAAHNFSTEIDINILGHIFEQSISDLETLQQVETISRRKKEGIYYTPSFITEFICKNTIFRYLSKSDEITNVEELVNEYSPTELEQLEKKLKNIKILDPACGSGAFLNMAMELLQNIHERLYYKKIELGITKRELELYFDPIQRKREIILDNIYGVDLNEESIEITKLALFLKITSPEKVLPDLDSNIKCGNSLIENNSITDKAFNWITEFPDIKFDIIIGNPPYGAVIDETEKNYFSQEFQEISTGYHDTYQYFIFKMRNLLKDGGLLGYIVPNTFLKNIYTPKFRKWILENFKITQIIDAQEVKIFHDATVINILFFIEEEIDLQNRINNKVKISSIKEISEEKMEETPLYVINQKDWIENKPSYNFEIYTDPDAELVLNKIEKDTKKLGEVTEVIFGVKIYQRGKGVPNQTGDEKKARKFESNSKKDDTFVKFLEGNDIHRYFFIWENKWISYGEWLAEPRRREIFEQNKIIIRQVTGGIHKRILASYCEGMYVAKNTICIVTDHPDLSEKINLKYLTCLLNSKLMTFYNYYRSSNIQKDTFPKMNSADIQKFPIRLIKDNKIINDLIELSKNIQIISIKIHDLIEKFINRMMKDYNMRRIPKRLLFFYGLEYKEIEKEIEKSGYNSQGKRIQLKKSEKDDLEDYFNEKKKGVIDMIEETIKLDGKIDETIYFIYGLNKNDIKVIERYFK